MNTVDLIYLHTITAMLESVRADHRRAQSVGDPEQASLLESRIGELLDRRNRISRSLFDFAPAVALA